MIRRAAITDVPDMGRIINAAAEFGLMLHRSQAYLYEHIRDFHVAVDDNAEGNEKVVGVCGLNVIWATIAEVYALAVDRGQRGRGIGGRLVQACIDEARQLGIPRVMSLTYEKRFFERLGFTVVDRQSLPLKVWSQCVHCSKNQACDEIAMIHHVQGVTVGPTLAEPQTGEHDDDSVPVPITIGHTRPAPDGRRPLMDEPPAPPTSEPLP